MRPPPRVARGLARLLAPADLRASFIDDLDEAFDRRAALRGRPRACWWYRWQVIRALWMLSAFRLGVEKRAHAADGGSSFPSPASRARPLAEDLRSAWRVVRRRQLSSLTAMLSLALGIGASTALYAVVNGVLLRPLNLPDADRLMLIGERMPQLPGSDRFAFFDNPAAILAWRARATRFAGLGVIAPSQFSIVGDGAPRLVRGAHVSTDFFDVLQIPPQRGRLLVAADVRDVARPMVITDRLWHSAFGGDPSVVGRRIGAPTNGALVVGILPAGVRLDGRTLGPMLAGLQVEYFDALRLGREGRPNPVFSDFNYSVIGRLKPGTTASQALSELDGIQADLARSSPEKLSLFAELVPLRDYVVGEARRELWLLFGGVLTVLLIVCVNLSGLSLTRVADGQRDWAIRTAMGASPVRLARQLLGENLILALVGGALGVAAGSVTFSSLVALAPADVPRLDEVHVDWRVLFFALVTSVTAGIVSGLIPALRLLRGSPHLQLKAAASSTTLDRSSLRSRRTLIGVQAAFSTLLLAMTGLLGLSFYRLINQPTGFDAAHALEVDVTLGAYATDAQRDDVLRRLPAEIRSLPGVEAAGFTSHLPLKGETWIDVISVPGRFATTVEQPKVNVRFVSSGYFRAIGMPIVAGRDVAETDRSSGPPSQAAAQEPPGVVVLSRGAAKLLWPDAAPREIIGRALNFEQHTVFVIGVAEDTRSSLDRPAPATAYAPYWEMSPGRVAVVVRTTTPAATLAGPLRDAVWRIAPNAPVPVIQPLTDLEDAAVASQRYQFTALGAFAALALFLAVVGVYALVAHAVARRRRELALRLTLGARASDLQRLIVRQGVGPVAVGTAVGILAALTSGQLIESLLFETSASDPLVLSAVAASVLSAAALACLPPARRAARTDPWAALRSE